MGNKDLLQKSNVAYIKPEQIKTFEIGYKSLLFNKLMIDANYYASSYTDFILNTVVIQPENPVLGSDGTINPAAAADVYKAACMLVLCTCVMSCTCWQHWHGPLARRTAHNNS